MCKSAYWAPPLLHIANAGSACMHGSGVPPDSLLEGLSQCNLALLIGAAKHCQFGAGSPALVDFSPTVWQHSIALYPRMYLYICGDACDSHLDVHCLPSGFLLNVNSVFPDSGLSRLQGCSMGCAGCEYATPVRLQLLINNASRSVIGGHVGCDHAYMQRSA